MTTYGKIYKNSFILTALRVIEPLMTMAIIIAISRVLGAETLGAYSFLNSFTAMFGAASQMGLHALIVREVAHRRDEASIYLSSALFIGIATSSLLAVIMNISKTYFGLAPDIDRCIIIMSVNLLPLFVIYTFESIFVAFERMDLIFTEQILSSACRVIASLVIIWNGHGILYLISVNVFTSLLTVLFCLYQYNKHIDKLKIRFNMDRTLALIKSSPVFLMTTIISMLSARVDILILTKFTDLTQVALYSAAYRIFEMCMILPQAYYKSTFPQLSRLCKTDDNAFIGMSNNVMKHSSYYLFVTTPFIFMASPFIIRLIYGDKFAPASVIMQILLVGLVPWGGARIFANLLVARDLQRYDLLASILATVLNVVLNLQLIPVYGMVGAAIANTCSLSLFFVLELCFIKYFLQKLTALLIITIPACIALAVLSIYFVTLYVANISMLLVVSEFCLLICCGIVVLKRCDNLAFTLRSYVSMIREAVRTRV